MKKLSFDDLCGLLDRITSQLGNGKITIETYVKEWDAIVEFAGWSTDEFEDEVGKLWTGPPRMPSIVFLC